MAATRFSEAKAVYARILEWLKNVLELTLSKWHTKKLKRGANFVGYRTWKSVRFIRKRSLYNFSKALKAIKINSLISIVGNAKRTATYAYFMLQLKTKGIQL